MGKAPVRKVTPADREAAARLKSLWLAIPRERRPTQQALAEGFPGEATQSLISQYMLGRTALNYRAVRYFAHALGCKESEIRADLPEQQIGTMNDSPTSTENKSRGKSPSKSQSVLPDRGILHESLTLLMYDLLHGGDMPARAQTARLLELYARVAADGGELTRQHNDEFLDEVNARGLKNGTIEQPAPNPASHPRKRVANGDR